MASPTTSGTCLCGSVRFEIPASEQRIYQCHCSLCRKQGGSASNSSLLVAKEHFRWLAGESLITAWSKPTGFRSHFCSVCGAPVPNPLRESPWYWVPAGLLEGEQQPSEIVAHICVESKAPWDPVAAPGEQFDTIPELDEVIRLLHPELPASTT